MAVKVLDGAQVFEPTERWTVSDAAELYDVNAWGKGYFSVGANGHLWVHPAKDNSRGIDLKELVDKLVLRGIHPPILIRFGEILKHRLGEIHGGVPECHSRARIQGRIPLCVSDQGEPAASGRRGGLRVRQALSFRAGSRARSRNSWR